LVAPLERFLGLRLFCRTQPISHAMKPDWFTAIGTTLLGLIAFYTVIRDEWRNWIRRPEFRANFVPRDPDCLQTPTEGTRQIIEEGRTRLEMRRAETHYIRARIHNTGNLGAKDVEVAVLEVRRRGDADNTFHPIRMGTPWSLTWAHQRDSHVLRRLPVHAERHIDLGHIIDPTHRAFFGEDHPGANPERTLFCLAFFVKSNTGEYLLDPGFYEIDFRIYAANAQPSPVFTFRLDHKGTWFSDENRMYADALGMSVIDKS